MDIDAPNFDGLTALHLAVMQDFPAAAALLAASGADVDAECCQPTTAQLVETEEEAGLISAKEESKRDEEKDIDESEGVEVSFIDESEGEEKPVSEGRRVMGLTPRHLVTNDRVGDKVDRGQTCLKRPPDRWSLKPGGLWG